MPFDYKKEYKEFYLPPQKPQLLEVPPMNYVAVRGHGDPNAQDGEYQAAIGMLYAVAFTIKMSYKGTHQILGYFEYVVPPLEGLWWQEGVHGVDYTRKADFRWISLIRLPEFATQDVFVDRHDSPAGVCNQTGVRLGRGRSCRQEKAGSQQSGVLYL